MSPERNIKAAVVLHVEEDGSYDLKAFDKEGEVLVLWIDERCPGDRVYEMTSRDDPAELKALIGTSTIGHARDGRLSEEKVQAIKAMAWRLDGNKLGVVAPEDHILNGEPE